MFRVGTDLVMESSCGVAYKDEIVSVQQCADFDEPPNAEFKTAGTRLS
jgi:hypothetical protein